MRTEMGLHKAEAVFGFESGYEYSSRDVKRVYRNLVKKNHPDAVRSKGISQEEANERMSEINKAYTILNDATRIGSVIADPFANDHMNDTVDYAEDFADFMRDVANGKYKAEYEEDWFDRQERERREAQAKAREEYARKKAEQNAEYDKRANAARNATPVGRVYNWCGAPLDNDPEWKESADRERRVAREAYNHVVYGTGNAHVDVNTKATGRNADMPLVFRALRAIVNCEALWRVALLFVGLWFFNQSAYGSDAFLSSNQPLMLMIMMLTIANLIFGFITRPIRKGIVRLIDKAFAH